MILADSFVTGMESLPGERAYGVRNGWFYAYGFPGCLWDSDPIGPFDTEEEALAEARG